LINQMVIKLKVYRMYTWLYWNYWWCRQSKLWWPNLGRM